MTEKQRKFGVIANKIVAGFLVIIFISIFYVAWQRFKPYKITSVETPIVVKDKTVHEGEPVTLLLTTCGYEPTRITIRVQLVTDDGTATPLFTLYDFPQPKGCTKMRPTIIPLDRAQLPLNPDNDPSFEVDDENFPIAQGAYKLRLKVTYDVNRFRQITKDYDSEQFQYMP